MRTLTLIGALAAMLSAATHAGESGDAAAGPQFRIAAGAEVTSEQSVYVQGDAVVTVLPGVYALWGRFYVRGPALGVKPGGKVEALQHHSAERLERAGENAPRRRQASIASGGGRYWMALARAE